MQDDKSCIFIYAHAGRKEDVRFFLIEHLFAPAVCVIIRA